MSKSLVRLCGLVSILAMLLACTATSAQAKPHVTRVDRSLNVEFNTRASNGYRASLFAVDNRVALELGKGPFSATYEVRGLATSHRLEANFGKLGRISLRFKSARTTTTKFPGLPNCPPARSIHEFGVFRGSLRFVGEQGFTRIGTHRVRGEVEHIVTPECDSEPPGRGPSETLRHRAATDKHREDVAELSATSKSHGRVVDFSASRLFGYDTWFVEASTLERRGRISIDRDAIVFEASPSAIVVSKPGAHPAKASVKLPRPFQGTAAFAEEPVPPAPAWEGSLSVSMSGLGPVALAGRGFEAFLCSERSLTQLEGCQEETLGIANRR
jgi:hypothetical protein